MVSRRALFVERFVRDRAAGACSCAHARGQSSGRSPSTNSPLDCLSPGSLPRARKDWHSSFTSLRSKPHRPAPIHRFGSFNVTHHTHRKPGTSGGQRSEIKGEGRVFSGPEDIRGVAHPMAMARAPRNSERNDAASARPRQLAFALIEPHQPQGDH